MPLSRRHFFFGALALPAAAQKKKAAGPKPNVILIVADDLASWMLGCYGNREIHTPNIDGLARMGTRFVYSYACTPAGPPSRATLLTGRTPMQHGLEDSAPPPSFAGEIMLSDLLADAGYDCGYAGKWAMGNDGQPQHHFNFWQPMPGGAGAADLVTSRAIEFLERRNAARPFFLVAGYPNPGDAYEGQPRRYYDMYDKVIFESFGYQPAVPNAARDKDKLADIAGNIRKCAASTTALDDQIGTLVNKIHQLDLADNTLVVFTSPNGSLLGRHGLWSDGLASDPPNMYEEAIQVPMLWSWLGHIPADNTRPNPISLYDFLPTICEVTGLEVPARNLCGRSYWPLVTNQPFPKKNPWRPLLFGHLRSTEMVRDSRYKLVERAAGKGPGELYDLPTDPRERANQYANGQFVNTRDRLSADLAAWRGKYSK